MRFQAVTVALIVGAFAAPFPQKSSRDVAAPQYDQPTFQPEFSKEPEFIQTKDEPKDESKDDSKDVKDFKDVDALPEEFKHSLEWKDSDFIWYKPKTWFGKDANDKIEKGAAFVGEGVIGGAMGAVGFKIGEELYNELNDAYNSNIA